MRDLGDRVRELRFEGPEGHRGITVWHGDDEEPNVIVRRAPDRGAFAFSTRGNRFFEPWQCPGDEDESRGFLAFSDQCVGGLELLELKPGLADYFGTSEGVLVSDVHEESTLGLEPGDVILAIDGRGTTDPDQVRRILGSYDDDENITLRIMRQQREMSVQGQLRG
jgi:hypothetical protein